MEEWIQALKITSQNESYHSNKELLNGVHNWYVCSHARPTFCNVCREALNGVTSHGLSCEVCKFKAHKRCAPRAEKNCKWTTLASIGSKEIIEDEDRNIFMPHQWLEGNLPVNAKCSYCDKACGSVLRMQDFRCLWCKSYVHNHCKDNFYKKCNFGVCRVSILTPIHINTVASDGYIRASKAHNSSPLVVFVNSKSGDNQGVKFLRKFKQLLNPFQVFDLIEDGPVLGLRLFQKFDCFRVLVCGGDGSVGWVLKEIDNHDLHKQCQIGVLPLGTGNDLARVLGWGAALDDDNQLAKLLESFERATTKMLDRWSMMTYEIVSNSNTSSTSCMANSPNTSNVNNKSNLNSPINSKVFDYNSKNNNDNDTNNNSNTSKNKEDIPIGVSDYSMSLRNDETDAMKLKNENICHLEDSIWYHLSNMLQNENINNIIESSQVLQNKVTEALIRVNDMYNNYNLSSDVANNENYKKRVTKIFDGDDENRLMNAMAAVVTDQCISLKHKLNEFFSLLKAELRTSSADESSESIYSSNESEVEIEEPSKLKAPLEPHEPKIDSFSSASSLTSIIYTTDNNIPVDKQQKGFLNVNITKSQNLSTDQEIYLSSTSVNLTSQQTIQNQTHGTVQILSSCNSSINRRLMLNSISKLFRHRRIIMTRANSLKRSIKQILQLADKNNTITSMISTTNTHFMSKMSLSGGHNESNLSKTNSLRSNKSRELDVSITDSDTKKLLVQKIENMDDLVSYRHVSYDEYDDDIDFNRFRITQSKEDLIDHETDLLSSNDSNNLNSFDQNSNNHEEKNKIEIPKFDKLPSNSKQLNLNLDCLLKDPYNFEKKLPISNSFSSGQINESHELMAKSPSNLTINNVQTLCTNLACKNQHCDKDTCPLASEEQSCISTPTQTNTKCSLSIESFVDKEGWEVTKSTSVEPQTCLLSRPNKLTLVNCSDVSNTPKVIKENPRVKILQKERKDSDKCSSSDQTPQINITITDTCDSNREIEYDSDFTRIDNSRSPSFVGYLTSQSSLAVTPSDTENSQKVTKKSKLTPPPLFLLPPSASSSAIKTSNNNLNLNSSSSSNNLSARLNEFNFLRLPASPSGYSSSGSCYSKMSYQPSPRISKKYSQETKTSSTYHLKLPGKRGFSAISSTFRQRSQSKSSDKSSSPTSPSSPKFLFKYNPTTSPFGFVGQALLFNTDTLCAPIAQVNNEPISDLFAEKAVMNNYFGIGLDAKLSLEFHMTREEHPEKCKSRMRNNILYGILGSKEFIQRTYKNLEQKVLLECDGTKIPLKNVQGIVVLNIPSYTGGVNFWGHNSKTEHTFTVPSFDDKILEVVAVSGCMQMALSRVVSIKSNRIAQCRSVKIQILCTEGVPVQVDGEAWIQPPGFIYLVHKNRAQMLTRNKVFEHTLKTWSEKQKNDPHLSVTLSKEEFNVLQYILDDSITLIKRIKTASLKNTFIEKDLYGYATQASSNLDEICINGKIFEKSLRQQVTDFLNSIRTLHVETGLFINEKATKLNIDIEIIEKIQTGLNDLKISMKKLNDCHGLFQFPIDTDEASDDLDFKKKSRFNLVQRYKKSKIKHNDNKELLKTLHSIPIEEWGTHEVSLWLESINMSEYKTAFLRHDIRGTEIRNLERRDLRELGIVKVGHIKRILNGTKDIPKIVRREKQSV